ncbi:uncharacterized protein METZ01_LOCUS388081 [marine metagenome]|uniref:Uncharacterized protein n=1 Tax=marine metagenome TaxID=408172 RepID=A0A382UMC7_9ZZZZ
MDGTVLYEGTCLKLLGFNAGRGVQTGPPTSLLPTESQDYKSE